MATSGSVRTGDRHAELARRAGRAGRAGEVERYRRSMMVPVPRPPPQHIDTRP